MIMLESTHDSTLLLALSLNNALATISATSARVTAPQIVLSSVRTALPVFSSLFRPPGRMITNCILSAFSMSRFSAFSFSISTGFSTSYTSSGVAPLLSPVPMEVTRTNLRTPFSRAALMMFMLPSLSAVGLAVVPPMVDTTASTSSMSAKALATVATSMASPLDTTAIMPSISARRSSVRCSIHTQLPMFFSLRVTSSATPPPPQTRMDALSGSRSRRSPCASTLRALLRPAVLRSALACRAALAPRKLEEAEDSEALILRAAVRGAAAARVARSATTRAEATGPVVARIEVVMDIVTDAISQTARGAVW
mmetsp:Transcript_19570/g.49245  ORF Transcript_19570/g.49245 Transcript_19570/m.49245 type:complete len:311 (+) Transcript_19570:150-1082(+)